MKKPAYQRHDLTDDQWEKINPELQKILPKNCPKSINNRRFINALLFRYRTGIPWRDLPPVYGHFQAVHKRYMRYVKLGLIEKLFQIFADAGDGDYEWQMLDSTFCKVHHHGRGAKGGIKTLA